MRNTEFDDSGSITRQEFLRRMGTVGVAATTMGVFASVDAPIGSAAAMLTTQSNLTQTLGLPGAPSKIRDQYPKYS